MFIALTVSRVIIPRAYRLRLVAGKVVAVADAELRSCPSRKAKIRGDAGHRHHAESLFIAHAHKHVQDLLVLSTVDDFGIDPSSGGDGFRTDGGTAGLSHHADDE